MMCFFIILFSYTLNAQNSKNLYVTFNNVIDGGIREKRFLKKKNDFVIYDEKGINKDYNVLSYTLEWIAQTYYIEYVKNSELEVYDRKGVLKNNLGNELFIVNIKLINNKLGDTINVNNIHLKFGNRNKNNKRICSTSNIFLADSEKQWLKLDYLLSSDDIPIVGDSLKIVSYIFSYYAGNGFTEIKVKSHKITNEVKDALNYKYLFHGYPINFSDIIAIDSQGKYYQLPMKRFYLNKLNN